MRVLCLLLPSASPIVEIAEACMRFTPQIALGEDSIFLEVGSVKSIYSEQTLVTRTEVLLKKFGLHSQVGWAEDIPTALAMARTGALTRDELPIEALSDYANPFARSSTLDKMIETMHRLGIHKVSGFLKLKPFEITSRFGKEGLHASLRVRDASQIVWPYFHPKERIIERFEIEDHAPLKNLEPILFILKGQIDRAVARLIGRSEKATLIEIMIEQENLSIVKEPMRKWPIELSLPQRSASTLLTIVRERLECQLRVQSLVAPVTLVQFSVLETVKAQPAQKDFFSKREEEQEAMASLIARLCERLGQDSSFIATPVENHRPEATWTNTNSRCKVDRGAREEGAEAYTSYVAQADRPLRVFREPKPVFKVGNRITCKDRWWKITNTDGPENISGDWWLELYDRDYYRVATDSGDELWVYRERGQYYLHGIFD